MNKIDELVNELIIQTKKGKLKWNKNKFETKKRLYELCPSPQYLQFVINEIYDTSFNNMDIIISIETSTDPKASLLPNLPTKFIYIVSLEFEKIQYTSLDMEDETLYDRLIANIKRNGKDEFEIIDSLIKSLKE